MNFVDLHLGDYEKAVARMSLVEEAIFWRLLRRYYDREQPLPNDQEKLRRISGATTDAELGALATVLEEFNLEADGYHYGPADALIARVHAKSAKARESAGKRWVKTAPMPPQADRTANALPSDSEGNANAKRSHSDGNANALPSDSDRSADALPTQSDGNAKAMLPSTQYPVPSISVGDPSPSTTTDAHAPGESETDQPRRVPAHAGRTPTLSLVETCQVLIGAGVPSEKVRHSHPTLHALVARGITTEVLTAIVTKSAARDPPPDDLFAWSVTAALNQLTAEESPDAHSRPGRRPSAVALVEAANRRHVPDPEPDFSEGPGAVLDGTCERIASG